MRTPSTKEMLIVGIPLSVALALGACGSSSKEAGVAVSASPSATPSVEGYPMSPFPNVTPSLRIIGATVINGVDKAGKAVGVRTYAGPRDPHTIGSYSQGEHVGVLCEEPGRTVTDTDVPKGHAAVVSKEWLRLNSGQQGWIGEGYVKIDGNAAVPPCPDYMVPAAASDAAENTTANINHTTTNVTVNN